MKRRWRFREGEERGAGAVRSDAQCIRDVRRGKAAGAVDGQEVQVAGMEPTELSTRIQLPCAAPVDEVHIGPGVDDEPGRRMCGQRETRADKKDESGRHASSLVHITTSGELLLRILVHRIPPTAASLVLSDRPEGRPCTTHDVKTCYIYMMKSRLVNVRLDAARLRKALALRERGVALSDVVREAIDERYGQLQTTTRSDVKAVVQRIFDEHPDPPDVPVRTYDVHDRAAARRAILRGTTRKKR